MSDVVNASSTGSPSLFSTLRQFRPRKRCATTPTTPLSDKGPRPRTEEPIPSPRESKDSILIPGKLESALKQAVQELARSSGQEHPEAQASACSTTSLEGSEQAGSGVKGKQPLSSNSEVDERPEKWSQPVYNRAKEALQVECSATDGLTKRYMTNRERSLKELRKEFQTTDIEAVLHALVACKWDVSRARAYLLNEPHLGGSSLQQSGGGPEEGDCKRNLASLVEALRKRGFCSDDVYVENLTRGLSQRKYLSGFRQPQASTDPKQCERPRTRRRRTELALEKAIQELSQSSERLCPDIQASCSSSNLKERDVAGRGVKRKQVPPSSSKGDKGPKKWGRPIYNRAKRTLQVECSVQDCVVRQHATNRERSLKELREEFKFTDIETVLEALVACNWDVVQAQAYLRNKFRFMGYSQQSGQGSEKPDVKTNLANMCGTLRKREEAARAEDDIISEDSWDESTSGGELPGIEATSSTSKQEKSRAAGSGVKHKAVLPSNSERDGDILVEHARDTTHQERSLKQLRKEFRSTDIVGSAVLQALVACNWDVGPARAYLVNKFSTTGDSQQHRQGSEERGTQPTLANLSGTSRKLDSGGSCIEGIYVKNLRGGLSKLVFRQHEPQEVREAGGSSDNEECCDENMYVKDLSGGLTKLGAFSDLEHCELLPN